MNARYRDGLRPIINGMAEGACGFYWHEPTQVKVLVEHVMEGAAGRIGINLDALDAEELNIIRDWTIKELASIGVGIK